jgi:hypothetical protein
MSESNSLKIPDTARKQGTGMSGRNIKHYNQFWRITCHLLKK